MSELSEFLRGPLLNLIRKRIRILSFLSTILLFENLYLQCGLICLQTMDLFNAWRASRAACKLQFGVDKLPRVQDDLVKCHVLPAKDESLRIDLLDFWSNWRRLPLLSFDTERSLTDNRIRYVILANVFGDVLIMDVRDLFYKSRESLFEELSAPFDEIMIDSIFCGSAISGDTSSIAEYIGCRMSSRVIDTAVVAEFYGPSLWPTSFNNRTGLGNLSHLSCGYDYKPYSSRSKFENRYGKLPVVLYGGKWPAFRTHRLYNWPGVLRPFERFYMALDGLVPLVFIFDCLQFVFKKSVESRMSFESAENKVNWIVETLATRPAGSDSLELFYPASFSSPAVLLPPTQKFYIRSDGNIAYNPSYKEPEPTLDSLGLECDEREAVTSSFLGQPFYQENLPAVRSHFESHCSTLVAEEKENGYKMDVEGNIIRPTYPGSVSSVSDESILEAFKKVQTPETPGWLDFWKYSKDQYPSYTRAWFLSEMSFAKLGVGLPSRPVIKSMKEAMESFKVWFDYKVLYLKSLEEEVSRAPPREEEESFVPEGEDAVSVEDPFEVENPFEIGAPLETEGPARKRKRKRSAETIKRRWQLKRQKTAYSPFARVGDREGLWLVHKKKFSKRCYKCGGFHSCDSCSNLVRCEYKFCLDTPGTHSTELCPFLNGVCKQCDYVGHSAASCEASEDEKGAALLEFGEVGINTRAWFAAKAWYRPRE